VLGGLVGDPEACSVDGEIGEYGTTVFDAEELDGSEGVISYARRRTCDTLLESRLQSKFLTH
jgi:hypothetical protein